MSYESQGDLSYLLALHGWAVGEEISSLLGALTGILRQQAKLHLASSM